MMLVNKFEPREVRETPNVETINGPKFFKRKYSFIPAKIYDDLSIVFVHNCASNKVTNPDIHTRSATLKQQPPTGSKTNVDRMLRDFMSRGSPFRFLPEIQMILPLGCCKIPLYQEPAVILDFSDAIQVYNPSRGLPIETHAIFTAKKWIGMDTMNACVDVKSWRGETDTIQASLAFSVELAATIYASRDLGLAPKVMEYWISGSSKSDNTSVVAGHDIASIPISYITTFIVYEKFDWTLGGFIRNQIHNFIVHVNQTKNTLRDYIVEMIMQLRYLAQNMVNIPGNYNPLVYMAAGEASQYVIYRHIDTGMPYKMRLVGWNGANMFNQYGLITIVDKVKSSISSSGDDVIIRFDENNPHYTTNQGIYQIYTKTLQKLANDKNYGKLKEFGQGMRAYAIQLFDNVMYSEVLDVLEIERNELLRNIYSGSTDIEVTSIAGYDEIVDHVREMAKMNEDVTLVISTESEII